MRVKLSPSQLTYIILLCSLHSEKKQKKQHRYILLVILLIISFAKDLSMRRIAVSDQ